MQNIQDSTFDEAALISRLTTALQRRPQQVICIVGSPFSAPPSAGGPGVPSVDGVIQMIREEFAGSDSELHTFEEALASAQGRKYQAAFRYLQGTRGQSVANELVRRAVLKARRSELSYGQDLTDGACRLLESDRDGWHLNPGLLSLGKLISIQPQIFGGAILTTNFDPLLEIAIRRAAGTCYKTVLHAEGSLTQTEAEGCHVIHLHGYWFGSDTLHTNRQLMQDRPRLRTSLANLLRDKLVLVCGYGGWDDVLTGSLLDLVRDDTSSIEVLWTLLGTTQLSSPVISDFLAAGISRGRVSFYSGIDCNEFFPRLLSRWEGAPGSAAPTPTPRSNPVRITPEIERSIEEVASAPRFLEGDNEDRPPVVDLCIGRDQMLNQIIQSDAKIIYITGIGGQGKSTLAASYFSRAQTERRFELFIWRDCKEEGETFENQIASLIEVLSGGALSGSDLAKRPLEQLVEILLLRLHDKAALLVFDNVDHFVNLETGRLTSAADFFIKRVLQSPSNCRIIFTCRPEVWQEWSGTLTLHLEGLSVDASIDLFRARQAGSDPCEIEDAHALTSGHAFWLDLLARQVLQNPGIKLSSLVAEIRSGQGPLPHVTLQSIWSKLKDREMLVLHALAESLRPATEAELGDYLAGDFNYNKLNKAMKSLRRLNLLVVKLSPKGEDLYELHPLVRRFVRERFTTRQRYSMIHAIIAVYNHFRGIHKDGLNGRPTFTFLQNWTQAAELAIGAGDFREACEWLNEARDAFQASAFAREYVRVVRLLLSSFSWTKPEHRFVEIDNIIQTHTRLLSHLGCHSEVDELLDKFSTTIPEPNSRFMWYCELRCHAAWIRGDFQDAIKWGERGQELYQKSNVDTDNYSEHSLALARRDAGNPEAALPVFLQGRSIAEVTDPEELSEESGGAYYGNVGRCLQFMGRIREALTCFQKSALLIEKNQEDEHVLNQGYIRLWIGELLMSRNQPRLGSIFLEAAKKKWEEIAPPRARQLEELLRHIRPTGSHNLCGPDTRDPEMICRDWIKGRRLDDLFD